MNEYNCYYYLHKNGALLAKSPIVVDMDPHYFTSPFIIKFWRVRNKEDHDNMVREVQVLQEKIKEKE